MIALNLGCWHTWREEAINIDRRLDPSWPDRRGMFVKDRMEKLDDLFHCESVREIWANDVFFGVSYSTIARMLQSWRKVLAPDGKLHILTDAHIPVDFLYGLLKELGYDVYNVHGNIRWTTIEAKRRGI